MTFEYDLKAAVRTIPDYPKPGILFRDITTLLGDARAFRRAVDELVQPWAGNKIDKVAGIEARGFIIGGAVAHQVSGLDKENQERQWERIKFLMTDDFTTTKALGWVDAERMKKDYELVQTYLGMEKPFAVETAFSTRLLDPSVKMDASKVKK